MIRYEEGTEIEPGTVSRTLTNIYEVGPSLCAIFKND